MNLTLDQCAPIEPGVGMAGLRLRAHFRERFLLIRLLSVKGDGLPNSPRGEAYLQSPYHVAYNLSLGVKMVFNMVNGRLYNIVASGRYRGSLFGLIHTGMSMNEARNLEPQMFYDDLEEVWKIMGIKGVAIDADGWGRKVEAISVYVTELDDALGDLDKIEAFGRRSLTPLQPLSRHLTRKTWNVPS